MDTKYLPSNMTMKSGSAVKVGGLSLITSVEKLNDTESLNMPSKTEMFMEIISEIGSEEFSYLLIETMKIF